MSIPLATKFEGKKFMWDGQAYETEDQAREVMSNYQKSGFEVHLEQSEDQYLVYSRRIAEKQSAD